MRSDPRGGTGGTWREGADKFGLRSSSRDNIPPKIETNEEDLSRDEDLSEEEERALQEHAAKMREEGMDSRVIDSAMRMARDVLRRQRQGHDRFPMRHHGDPWADRGSEAHDFELNSPEVGRGVAPPQGLDSRQEIREIRRQLKRFGPEVGCAPERYRGAQGAVPTMARKAKTEARYPGMARIEEV